MYFKTFQRRIDVYLIKKLVLVLFGKKSIFIHSIPLPKQYQTNLLTNKGKRKTINAVKNKRI